MIYVDAAKFQHMLDESGLNEAQIEEVLQAVWLYVVSVVDLGFEILPFDESCGKLLENEGVSAGADASGVSCPDTERSRE